MLWQTEAALSAHNWQKTSDYLSCMLPAPIQSLFPGRSIFTQPLSLFTHLFFTKEEVHLSSFPCLLLIKPRAQPPILPFSLPCRRRAHLSFISVSSRSPVGAEGWQPCVCPALLSAFLMSPKHRGSAYYGDEEIQAGQKVMDLSNRGPFSFPPPLLLTSPLISFCSLLLSSPVLQGLIKRG